MIVMQNFAHANTMRDFPASGRSVPRAPAPARFYRAETYFAADSVGLLMKRLVVGITGELDRRLASLDLTHAQWSPLLRLHTTGPSTVVELARWLQMDPGSTTRLLDRLERKALVRRMRSTTDRRVVHVEITPQGESAIADVPAVLAEVMNGLLAGFTHAEWQAMEGFLLRMLANGERMRAAP